MTGSAKQSIPRHRDRWIASSLSLLAMTWRGLSTALRQPPHHLVELFEVAVADLDAAAGIAMVDGHGKTERVADSFLQRQRVGVFRFAAAARFLRLALGHAFVMRQR